MIESILERAEQFINLKRYKEAERELKEVLALDPNRADALALYSICLAEQQKLDEAVTLIQNAISKEPDNDYFLYLQSLYFLKQDKVVEAEKFIRNAIQYQPHNADYFGLLASLRLNQKEWQQALEASNLGLAVDPDNLTCLNVRSTALFKLNKKEQAYETIQEALNKDPENEYTHCNIGWGLLERGDPKLALQHFRQALKINPNFDQAKAGLVEALKARYWFYRIFLKYSFWLANMKGKGQWVVILGLYFGIRFLGYVADTNPQLAVFLKPIIYIYIAFAISTWVVSPLSNLFLRLNIYGRYALTDNEIKASNFVGVSFMIGIAGGIAYLFTEDFLYLLILIYGISMMIPLASMLNPEKGKSKKTLIAYTILLSVIGLGAIANVLKTGEAGILFTIYIFGVVAYQWIANAMIIKS
jgi:tetratricopeptide (TPR) repeat protein